LAVCSVFRPISAVAAFCSSTAAEIDEDEPLTASMELDTASIAATALCTTL